jgi:integrase
MFKLSRRKGSAKWQVRKRWPTDVAAILPGEGFHASTGEEDRKVAQQRLPMIAAEFERRVAVARDQLAATPRDTITEAEAHRMAAEFYRNSLPKFLVRNTLEAGQQQQLLRDIQERIATLRAMQGRNEYSPIRATARTMTQQAGLALPDDSPSQQQLHRVLMQAFVALHEAAAARLAGEVDPAIAPASAAPSPAEPNGPGKTIEELLDAYKADKWGKWSGSSRKAFAPVSRVLLDMFRGREAGSITREDARAVVKMLEGLPANMGKRKELAGLTVPEAVRKGRELGLTTIGPKTINDGYLLHIASLFNWAGKEQWIASSPFVGLSVHDPVDDAERRDPFTMPQLQKLFTGAPWAAPWKPGGDAPGAFWVPLLCLFHGLRNGEAAGLRTEDIGEEDGLPVLRVRAYDGKRLKNREARATMPIHPELLRLGLLAHAKARREAGEALLFPEGTANSRGQIGAKLAERFSAKVKRMGFTGRKLGMHSFRHCFEDRLRAAELAERTALALARRTEAGSGRVYGDGLSLRQKAEALAKVVYPGLDLSHLCQPLQQEGDKSGAGES